MTGVIEFPNDMTGLFDITHIQAEPTLNVKCIITRHDWTILDHACTLHTHNCPNYQLWVKSHIRRNFSNSWTEFNQQTEIGITDYVSVKFNYYTY